CSCQIAAIYPSADASDKSLDAALLRRADQKDIIEIVSGQHCKRICRALTGPRWRWCRKKHVVTAQPSFLDRYKITRHSKEGKAKPRQGQASEPEDLRRPIPDMATYRRVRA